MKVLYFWMAAALLLITGGCTVMTPTVEKAALPETPFDVLLAHPEPYLGQTVILGGYVLEVQNHTEHTRLVVVQAPLGYGREPKSQDLSQGRIIATHKAFLDPEVYAKGRKITLGGIIVGGSHLDANPDSFPYLRVEVVEIYLWPLPTLSDDSTYWGPFWSDPFWGPYPYRWYWPHPNSKIRYRR